MCKQTRGGVEKDECMINDHYGATPDTAEINMQQASQSLKTSDVSN